MTGSPGEAGPAADAETASAAGSLASGAAWAGTVLMDLFAASRGGVVCDCAGGGTFAAGGSSFRGTEVGCGTTALAAPLLGKDSAIRTCTDAAALRSAVMGMG